MESKFVNNSEEIEDITELVIYYAGQYFEEPLVLQAALIQSYYHPNVKPSLIETKFGIFPTSLNGNKDARIYYVNLIEGGSKLPIAEYIVNAMKAVKHINEIGDQAEAERQPFYLPEDVKKQIAGLQASVRKYKAQAIDRSKIIRNQSDQIKKMALSGGKAKVDAINLRGVQIDLTEVEIQLKRISEQVAKLDSLVKPKEASNDGAETELMFYRDNTKHLIEIIQESQPKFKNEGSLDTLIYKLLAEFSDSEMALARLSEAYKKGFDCSEKESELSRLKEFIEYYQQNELALQREIVETRKVAARDKDLLEHYLGTSIRRVNNLKDEMDKNKSLKKTIELQEEEISEYEKELVKKNSELRKLRDNDKSREERLTKIREMLLTIPGATSIYAKCDGNELKMLSTLFDNIHIKFVTRYTDDFAFPDITLSSNAFEEYRQVFREHNTLSNELKELNKKLDEAILVSSAKESKTFDKAIDKLIEIFNHIKFVD